MPTTPETNPIIKCPHCLDEIDSLDFRADASERGSCSVYAAARQRRVGAGNNTRYEDIPGEYDAETEDFNTDDSEWNGDTDYYCPQCGDRIGLHELIIEGPEKQEKEEEIIEEEIEPEDAVESKTNIVLKFKEEDRGSRGRRTGGSNPIDAKEIEAFTCEECGHVFVVNTGRYERFNIESIVSCPLCGHETDPIENKQKTLAKAN